MGIDDIRKILRRDYGIRDDDEFEEAVSASAGIDIGIFTEPLEGGAENDTEQDEDSAA